MSRGAVIFDLDGTLVDTEGLVARAWADVATRHGYAITAQDEVDAMGKTDRDGFEILEERAGSLPPWPRFERETRVLIERRYPEGLRAFPDAVATVRALAMEGLPLAVCSSSPRWRLDLTLELLELGRYFDTTVAGDDTVDGKPMHGKPAPDLYAEAAHRLGVAPSGCIAIEDSAAGATAAATAGMRVIVVARPGAPPVAGAAIVSELDAELIFTWLGHR